MIEYELHENMKFYENPDLLPLENLKLTIKTNIPENVDALSKRWISDRYFLHYEAPKIYDDEGHEIKGAKAYWMEIVHYMIDDLKWLLSLPFYRFWSNIVFNTSILNALVSFLQEAPPFYALENFSNCSKMLELLNTLGRYVLVVFTRLVTNKESPQEYMHHSFLGNLLYENYIFTVPIIFDLCQLYGRENEKVIQTICKSLFTLEPRYNNDLERVIPCLIEAIENVERKFDGCSTCYTNEAVSLSQQKTNSTKFTLFNLEDVILYLLDIFSTVNVFLKNYYSAVNIFHEECFINKLTLIYETTIPEIYKALDKIGCNDENITKYIELKHRLDVTRIEMLSVFRIIIYEPILNIQENISSVTEAEMKQKVDEYLNILNSVMSEKEFITDYDRFYSVESDLKLLLNISSEVDIETCNYILQLVNATIGKPNAPTIHFSDNINHTIAGSNNISNHATTSKSTNSLIEEQTPKMNSVELASLVSEVTDILQNLDENFIKRCLEHYKYNTAKVINAVLEDILPPELKKLSPKQMYNPSSTYTEALVNKDLACAVEELNVRDDHNVCHPRVNIRKEIEIPKDYIIENYKYVADVYEDEYDDTYDNLDLHCNKRDDLIEIDSRPFTTPRILREQKVQEESESEDEDIKVEQNGKDHFIQNPEILRITVEQRRQAEGEKYASNVIGKPKGQGQEKSVLYRRQQKNAQKAKRGNHNRRSGANWKRSQGMIPS